MSHPANMILYFNNLLDPIILNNCVESCRLEFLCRDVFYSDELDSRKPETPPRTLCLSPMSYRTGGDTCMIDRENDRRYVAWDIETTGFAWSDEITVSVF